MCGILIHTEEFVDLQIKLTRGTSSLDLSHRGISYNSIKYKNLRLKHWVLPIQTANTDIKQPIEVGYHKYFLFNGEIFNYYEFGDFDNDVDYLKEFFSHPLWYKNEEIQRWDGFWSIVTIDGDKIYAFTDPLGKKQLYWNRYGISSEIKPLLYRSEINEKIFTDPFGEENVPVFKDVDRLKPNQIYVLRLNGNGEIVDPLILLSDYYDLWSKEKYVKSSLYDLIDKSVKDRCINRYDKITIFLSGGLDSSIILHHLVKYFNPGDLECLSIQNNEDKYVKILTEEYGLRVKWLNKNWGYYDDAVYHFEFPIDYGSMLPQYHLFKNSTNSVVFTGDGADELFGGYTRSQTQDTQQYDIFTELPYFHHIRLDRMSMKWTKECRNPFLSHNIVRYALRLKRKYRTNKEILKTTYEHKIPFEIINRKKLPLRIEDKGRSLKRCAKQFRRTFEGP